MKPDQNYLTHIRCNQTLFFNIALKLLLFSGNIGLDYLSFKVTEILNPKIIEINRKITRKAKTNQNYPTIKINFLLLFIIFLKIFRFISSVYLMNYYYSRRKIDKIVVLRDQIEILGEPALGDKLSTPDPIVDNSLGYFDLTYDDFNELVSNFYLFIYPFWLIEHKIRYVFNRDKIIEKLRRWFFSQ
mmetsp:Transcript_29369/g.71582  ORF Transcript_29369/g.71582 Transcript_29369/m.71582 type:complete len:187 (-) Transcript_29369:165-725(-)